MLSYSLGQIGPLVTGPGSSNVEVTMEMNGAASQGDPEAKDFRQAAEVMCVLLHNMYVYIYVA